MPSPAQLQLLATKDTSALARYLSQQSPVDCLDAVDAAAASTTALRAATASTVAIQTWLKSQLTSVGGLAEIAKVARQLRFTVAGVTPADAPASCVVNGKTWAGNVSETVTLPQTNTTVDTVNAFIDIDSIVFAAGDGAGATIALGFTALLGLPTRCRARGAGIFPIITEMKDGAAAANAGSLSGPTVVKPYGAYTAATVVPNGAVDFLVRYDADPLFAFT
jgi:hypothetical protein